ncbi:unnamed protein product [Ceratitis capitata]|uniref:(Mediterranean fruit fly) hypothetical protein n=1 Tax=Ceratitis capitata TaxID=7213 RepID=A0A811UNH8_CERCA|nr:unnamed protein product [Ceratitis capitata]
MLKIAPFTTHFPRRVLLVARLWLGTETESRRVVSSDVYLTNALQQKPKDNARFATTPQAKITFLH